MRARVTLAMCVQAQCMVGYFKSFGVGNVVLAFFNFSIKKFFHPAAIQTNQVVMVLTFIELIDRFATFKLTACQQAGLLKLHQYPVNGGQSNVGTFIEHQAVHVLGAHVSLPAFLEQLQNSDAGQCGF